uniref:Uncharacterized protein n=1 Tax=Salix viminalis TaxID=40686 RepID=A0A6N2KKF8_SALVM
MKDKIEPQIEDWKMAASSVLSVSISLKLLKLIGRFVDDNWLSLQRYKMSTQSWDGVRKGSNYLLDFTRVIPPILLSSQINLVNTNHTEGRQASIHVMNFHISYIYPS